MSGIRFRKEFGNIDTFRIEFGSRIIANLKFPFKFGRIAVLVNKIKMYTYKILQFRFKFGEFIYSDQSINSKLRFNLFHKYII